MYYEHHHLSTSRNEGQTSHPTFLHLLLCTSGFFNDLYGLRKILHSLCLPLLMMLVLWEYHMNDLDKMAHLDLHLPTIQGVHVCVHGWFTTSRWGVTCFYQKLRLCSCGTKP